MKKSAVRIACFILLLSGVLWCADRILAVKYGDGIYDMTKFYQLEDGSVDVLVLGSSHAFENINTGTLWDQYGIASYVLAGSMQPMWNTYYYLKEALKTQEPKLVVLEAYMLRFDQDYADDSRIIKNTFGMKWSPDKLEAVKASAPRERWPEFMLEYIQYHTRYTELAREDFLPDKGDIYYKDWKGFGSNMETERCERPDVSGVTDRRGLSEKTETYFRMFMELARENGIPVLIIAAPYAGITEQDQMIFNTVGDLAEEYGAGFINYNLREECPALDYGRDMADVSHLNYRGNRKLAAALGAYIRENYPVPDRRGDAAYASWERNARYIEAQTANQELKETEDAASLAARLQNPDYLVFASVDGSCTTADENLAAIWDALGISRDAVSGIWCVDMAAGPLYISGLTPSRQYIRRDYHDFLLERAFDPDRGIYYNTVTADGENRQKTVHGVNIVVYSRTTQEIADCVGIRTDAGYSLVR